METRVTFKGLGADAQGVSKKGSQWSKQEIICSTMGEYPKDICFIAFNDLAAFSKIMTQGKVYNIAFDLESREWNGKWYTDVRAIAINEDGAAPKRSTNDLPF